MATSKPPVFTADTPPIVSAEIRVQGGPHIATVEVREGSAGYRRCGVTFNPSQDYRVAIIKGLAAALMDTINSESSALDPSDGDGKRCMATAMTQLESAQMFAVKGLFMKPPDTG